MGSRVCTFRSISESAVGEPQFQSSIISGLPNPPGRSLTYRIQGINNHLTINLNGSVRSEAMMLILQQEGFCKNRRVTKINSCSCSTTNSLVISGYSCASVMSIFPSSIDTNFNGWRRRCPGMDHLTNGTSTVRILHFSLESFREIIVEVEPIKWNI